MNETRAYPQTAYVWAWAEDPTVRIVEQARSAVADGTASGELAEAITSALDAIEQDDPASAVVAGRALHRAMRAAWARDRRWTRRRVAVVTFNVLFLLYKLTNAVETVTTAVEEWSHLLSPPSVSAEQTPGPRPLDPNLLPADPGPEEE